MRLTAWDAPSPLSSATHVKSEMYNQSTDCSSILGVQTTNTGNITHCSGSHTAIEISDKFFVTNLTLELHR